MIASDLMALGAEWIQAVLDSPSDLAAYTAALAGAVFVVAGAFVRTMIPLRWLAVGSSVSFLAYGVLHPSLTTFLVAALLLPVNLYRVREMTRLTRQVGAAQAAGDLAGLWLRPYMKTRRVKPGQVLFHRGDRARFLYLLVDGELELAEIGQRVAPGRIFGEIALFSPSHRRTHTVRCVTAATVLRIDEQTVKQLFYQEPSFGFHLIGLVAARLLEDLERSERLRAGLDVDTASQRLPDAPPLPRPSAAPPSDRTLSGPGSAS